MSIYYCDYYISDTTLYSIIEYRVVNAQYSYKRNMVYYKKPYQLIKPYKTYQKKYINLSKKNISTYQTQTKAYVTVVNH